MKIVHNVLMTYQWTLLVAGAVAAVPLFLLLGPQEGLLSLVVSLLSLASLKLEVLAFAR